MILHLDHVALSPPDFGDCLRFLESLGYENRFVVRGAKNMNIKSCLLERFSENQHLALCAAPESISIEIVDHGHIGTGFSNNRPILENLPPDLIDPSRARAPLLESLAWGESDQRYDYSRWPPGSDSETTTASSSERLSFGFDIPAAHIGR